MYTISSKLLPRRTIIRNTIRTLQSRHLASQTHKQKNNRTSWNNRRYGTAVGAEPFINGTSSSYVEEMYESWKEDPTSVHKVSILCLLVEFSLGNLLGHEAKDVVKWLVLVAN